MSDIAQQARQLVKKRMLASKTEREADKYQYILTALDERERLQRYLGQVGLAADRYRKELADGLDRLCEFQDSQAVDDTVQAVAILRRLAAERDGLIDAAQAFRKSLDAGPYSPAETWAIEIARGIFNIYEVQP